MKKIKKHLVCLLKDESGQGTTEYIMILVGVVALGFIFKEKVVAIVKSKMEGVGGEIQGFSAQQFFMTSELVLLMLVSLFMLKPVVSGVKNNFQGAVPKLAIRMEKHLITGHHFSIKANSNWEGP